MQWIWNTKTKSALGLLALGGCALHGRGPMPQLVLPNDPGSPALADTVQSAGITDPQKSALALTSYDEVLPLSWPAAGEEGVAIRHASLPIPSYVEITRLDTGQTILARVAGRPIGTSPANSGQLSYAAAELLALGQRGTQAFRVRRVNPTEQDRAALRQGMAASARLDTPDILLVVLRKRGSALKLPTPDLPVAKPATVATRADAGPAPVTRLSADHPQEKWGASFAAQASPATSAAPSQHPIDQSDNPRWFIQIAALSSEQRAKELAAKSGARISREGALFRVRAGPYPHREAAMAALGRVHAKGYPEARITR